MASLITTSSLTLNPKEAKMVSEVIAERVYNNPALRASHAVFTGIGMKTQIPFAGLMGRMGAKVTDCTMPVGTGFAMTQKYWDPVDWGFRLTHCQKDLDQLFKVFATQAPRHSGDDIQGSQELDFIATRVTDAVLQNLIRMIWFGDTTMDVVSEGGYLAEALDGEQAAWTAFNGLWPQIIADSAIPYVAIDENAEAAEADQYALGTTTAIDTLKAMIKAADSRLISDPARKFYISRTLAHNFEDYLEDKSLGFSLERAEGGTQQYSYRGIPIEVRDDWDRTVVLFDDGTVIEKPHRALLTVPGNIPVGTMDEESLSHLESWYEKKDRTNIIDVIARLDVKILESYMAVKAY